MPIRHLFLLLILFATTRLPAAVTLENMRTGIHVSGPELHPSEFAGRVVLIEYWGVQCPPCLSSIPHLTELQAKYGRDRLLIVANQVQKFDAPTVDSTWREHGGDDQITLINQGRLNGESVSAIPHCFLFSHTGELLYDGSPFEPLTAPLEAALKASPGHLVYQRSYQKTAKQAAALGALSSNLAATLTSLRKSAGGDDAVAQDEAAYLLAQATGYATQNLARLQELRPADAVATTTLLIRMVGLFSGDELGAPFEALTKELKQDKAFQTELKAHAVLEDVRARAAKLGLDRNPEDAKRNRQGVAQIAELVRAMQKKFPDTKATKRVLEWSKRWQL